MSQNNVLRKEAGVISVGSAAGINVKGSGALGNFTALEGQYVFVTTTGAATATLGAATIGRVKTVVMVSDNGDLTLSPSTIVGGTTVTFGDIGDSGSFVMTSAGWVLTAAVGVVVA